MNYPDWLIQDIRILVGLSNIENLIYTDKDGIAEIRFDFEYDQYAQIEDERLINPEPILLKYKITPEPESPLFLSGRGSFPRDLPHLNPEPESHPASICLWRNGGNSGLYTQKGISACINVLGEWLKDASISRLQCDGWEPTPRTGLISFNIQLSEWQELAIKTKNSGKILTFKTNVLVEKIKTTNFLFGISIPEIKGKVKTNNSPFLRPFKYAEFDNIKTHYIISDVDFIEEKHNSTPINSFDSLIRYSSNPMLAQVKVSIMKEKKRKGLTATIFLIVQRRPLSLIEGIPGLSLDTQARKVELIAILVTHENNKFEFHQLVVKSTVTPELLSNVSGLKPTGKEISIIGCGSVGGAIADYLVRSGHTKLALWDEDQFEAHNNARHVLSQDKLENSVIFNEFKSMKMERWLKKINSNIQIKCFRRNFDTNELINLRNSGQVIDATGQIIEPSWLNKLSVPYSRIFIADEGRLSFFMSQLPSGPIDILDLEAAIYSFAISDIKIQNWLQRESSLSNKMLGLSCSSATLEMPWFKINNHVSALMPTLLNQILKPKVRVVMNCQDKEGNPEGVTIYDTSTSDFEFIKFDIDDLHGKKWIVSINEKSSLIIENARNQYLPNESSGYIFGLYNLSERRISIVDVTIGTFHGSRINVSLESINKDSKAQKILQATNEMLLPLGTWHSHPGNSASPSRKDETTFAELISCKERIIPTVMLIKANEELKVMVGINRTI
ncbi:MULTISPECIES: ThiF family adenylyltransferase [Colwellia]|uniref:Adenylyltransferase n=1 Tax=Colwellia marinimaniae TaxID=1513592 RepID=A0ABQ0MXN2_9GAMM|nr:MULTISPECIES: ThiF family adenylyltransferase [Colwellia]GAW97078.1 adenylyltransferase [Colwellia marinimaniae]